MPTLTPLDPSPLPPTEPVRFPPPPPPRRRKAALDLRVALTIVVILGLVGAFAAGRASAPDAEQVSAGSIQPAAGTIADGAAGINFDSVAAVARAAAPSVVQLETTTGLGSGVIYDERGLILTAAHVVSGSGQVTVRLADGRQLDGVVVGAHELTDIAVVQVDTPDRLPVAMLGYGDQLEIGELAVALGSPFGFDQTVTAGIVSAVGRPVNGIPMVQTDAAINPGNSGGPLLDGNAHVIGINDIIFTQGGGSDGIGFAVSIELAIVVAEQITAGRDVELSSLGVAAISSPSGEIGAIIQAIADGSPARTAGLAVGDRIVGIAEDPVDNPSQLFSSILTHRPNTTVTVDFVRDSVNQRVEVVLAGIQP